MNANENFPRPLTPLERDILLWLLPEGRGGYDSYRRNVLQWLVVAAGRRGRGNYVLAPPDARVDLESPLPQIFAVGMIHTDRQTISATVREQLDDQIEFEIVTISGEGEPSLDGEQKRWSLSYWSPGEGCPICGRAIREVSMTTTHHEPMNLALCAQDQRVWIHDRKSQVNHLIPPTNFYNELMLHKNVRDPRRAFDASRLFTEISSFSDADLIHAFRTYNQIRTKVSLEGNIVLPTPRRR